jgi:NADH-quinone oxidoreductase subunit E
MSVRRLAEDSVQPASFAFSAENSTWAENTIRKYPEGRQQSAVIPLLMRAQDQEGWVSKPAIEEIAGMLKMPLIRVLEVATFYTQFQLKPIGTKAHIQVCGTTPCMLRGSDDLKRVCQSKIHPEQFHLNTSGTLSWEEVECLGACVNAPMVMVFKDTYEDLTPERLEEIIDEFERGADVKVGPQIDRHLSAPEGGLTSLMSADEQSHAPTTADAAQQVSSGEEPSNAGRPRTHAAETDPSIQAPGKATDANVSQTAEAANSIDPSKGAHVPGAGSTGGTVEGPTGAGDKEHDATKAATTEATEKGDLKPKRAAAAPRVKKRNEADAPTEGARATDDLAPAPGESGRPK